MDEKTIVITGSTRGIGYGLAVKLLEKGHKIVMNGKNAERLEEKVAELKGQGL